MRPKSLERGVVGGAGGPGLGYVDELGWGGCCYQLSFQQDAFQGREEGLVHSKALDPCNWPLFRRPVPAIQSTEHLHEAHQAQPLTASKQPRKGNRKTETWQDREADRRRKAL